MTGAAGFIGRWLVSSLVDCGVRVRAVDTVDTETAGAWPDGVTFTRADATDAAAMAAVIGGCRAVFHLASSSGIRGGAERRDRDLVGALDTTRGTLEAVIETSVPAFVLASTSAVYGRARGGRDLTEDLAPQPISVFGAAKVAAEALASAYAHLYGVTVTVTRLGNVVGPGMVRGVLPDFARTLAGGAPALPVLGDGRQEKSWVHVADCVEAMVTLPGRHADQFAVFNVATGETLAVRQVAERAVALLGREGTRIEYGGGEGGWAGDVPRIALDVTRAREHGWTAARTTRSAIDETLQALGATQTRQEST